MFQHLLPNPEVSYPKYSPPGWSNVKYQHQINLARVKNYYGNRPTAVLAQHMLIRLIHAVAVPKSLPLDRFYDNVANLSSDISSVFFLTSSYSYGRFHNGVFYNCPEIIFADFSPFDYEEVNLNWRTAQPIKVVYHPYSDLRMNLPEPANYPERAETAFISINVAMLMVQYRAFRNEELAYQKISGTDMRSIYQFVRMHVLPNMLDSHFDIALMNVIGNIAKGIEPDNTKSMHSFPLLDVTTATKNVLGSFYSYFNKVAKSNAVFFESMPLVAHGSIADALYLPDDTILGNNRWAMALAWLPYVELYLSVSPSAVSRLSVNLRKEVVDGFRRLTVSRAFTTRVPPVYLKSIEDRISAVIEKFTA